MDQWFPPGGRSHSRRSSLPVVNNVTMVLSEVECGQVVACVRHEARAMDQYVYSLTVNTPNISLFLHRLRSRISVMNVGADRTSLQLLRRPIGEADQNASRVTSNIRAYNDLKAMQNVRRPSSYTGKGNSTNYSQQGHATAAPTWPSYTVFTVANVACL